MPVSVSSDSQNASRREVRSPLFGNQRFLLSRSVVYRERARPKGRRSPSTSSNDELGWRGEDALRSALAGSHVHASR